MSDNEQQQPVEQQPTGTTEPETNALGVKRVPAPVLPPPGAAIASPMTGAGPHRSEQTEEQAEEKKIADAPPIPTSQRPTRPPKPSRPKRPNQKPGFPRKPQAGQSEAGVPPQQPPLDQPVCSQPADQVAALPLHDPAVASLMLTAMNQQRHVGQKFLLVIVPEDNWPRVETHDEIQTCLDAIKELLGSNCHVYAFMGQQMKITAGPNRFLHTPMGPMPLFDIPTPDAVEEEELGWLGTDLMVDQVSHTAEEPDEFEEENEEGGNEETADEENEENEEAPTVADEDSVPGDDTDSPVF